MKISISAIGRLRKSPEKELIDEHYMSLNEITHTTMQSSLELL